MQYTKMRIEYKDGSKDTFYREVLIKGNPDLYKLSIFIGHIVGAVFEHCFLITINRLSYVMGCFLGEDYGYFEYKSLLNYNMSKLPSKFVYEYDTGEGYKFDCKIYKKKVNYNSTKDFILLEGKGQGLWEDNRFSLNALLNGLIDPSLNTSNDEKGYYLPWNFDNRTFGDFFNPLDIEEINKNLSKEFAGLYRTRLKNEIEYNEAYGIDLSKY